MKVGLYTDHLYRDGQVGTGVSKYTYYLLKHLDEFGIEVRRLHKGENPRDVDVLHDPHPPWNAPLWPKRPLVITVHDLSPMTHPQYYPIFVRTLFGQKLRWFVRRARAVIADSHRTEEVVSRLLRPTLPPVVVPLGVEDHFAPMDGPPADPPMILQVGIHRAIKEPMSTLIAFHGLAPRIPHQLRFVGFRSTLTEPIDAYVARYPDLRNRVRISWSEEAELPRLYNRASLVVHPCPEEGFGFVPLEALACGAHVLARAPAVRETLGPYGCYFEDDLGAKMWDCLQHPPKGTVRERSEHARRFRFRTMAERTAEVYAQAAGRAGSLPG